VFKYYAAIAYVFKCHRERKHVFLWEKHVVIYHTFTMRPSGRAWCQNESRMLSCFGREAIAVEPGMKCDDHHHHRNEPRYRETSVASHFHCIEDISGGNGHSHRPERGILLLSHRSIHSNTSHDCSVLGPSARDIPTLSISPYP